jgi:hypothetical protein
MVPDSWISRITRSQLVHDLRDVTRTRVALVPTRSQNKHRVHKLLEATNLKLGRVVSDLFGATGRRLLAALVAGARAPQV